MQHDESIDWKASSRRRVVATMKGRRKGRERGGENVSRKGWRADVEEGKYVGLGGEAGGLCSSHPVRYMATAPEVVRWPRLASQLSLLPNSCAPSYSRYTDSRLFFLQNVVRVFLARTNFVTSNESDYDLFTEVLSIFFFVFSYAFFSLCLRILSRW